MGRTQSKTEQFADEGVTRDDLNSTTAGKAVVKKLVQGTGVSLSSTGADAGTGDVTVSTPAAGAAALGHVTTGEQTFAGRKTFNDGVTLPEYNNGNSGAGTVTFFFENGNHQRITQTGNCTYAAPSGLTAGSNYLVRFIGDGTQRTPVFNAVFIFPGGVAPVIAATGSTLIGFYTDGTNLYCTGYTLIPNLYFTATDKIAGRATAAAGPGEEIACTAAGRALLDDADAAAQRATMAAAESVINSSYRTILNCCGSHTAARIAGKYGMGQGDPIAIDGTGTLYPLNTIYIDDADYPTINGLAPKLRIRAQLNVNNVAPTGNFTFGLYPITRPGSSGGTGLLIYTIGTVISGSDGATFTAPAADAMLSAVGADFAVPTDGHYIIGVVTTATVAATSHLHMSAQLQMRNA